ncbi:DUF4153 domain-containing protein [Clostridium manihotivorum]|uniref:DUF4173 domain-containing protein n=1 Tax=Clostridium manihotivorum TaxID=2320868 RepID=A0A3R5QQM4_9CLOT|nr:DUF4173 domain-containing protein [Clostridium manihotivorum]QAA30238.1 DUF4173 domain-containing protein [Clostridium manihotivorum]
MISSVVLILIKKNRLFVVSDKHGSMIQLPCTNMREGETITAATKRILEQLGIISVDIISSSKSIVRNEKRYFSSMVELTDDIDVEENEVRGHKWVDFESIHNLSFIENKAILYCLESYIEVNSNSNNINMLKDEFKRGLMGRSYLYQSEERVEKIKIDNSLSLANKRNTIIGSTILGIIFSCFFFAYLGISALIFNLIMIIVFVGCIGIKNKGSIMGYFLLTCSLILSASFSIYTNPVFRSLNIVLIPLILTLSFILFTYNDIGFKLTHLLGGLTNKLFKSSIVTSIKLPRFVMDNISIKNKSNASSSYKYVRNGILISIPLLLFLVLVLSKADNIFGYYINNISSNILAINPSTSFYKLVVAIVIAFYSFGFLWSFNYRFYNNTTSNSVKRESLEPITVTTVLAMVCILYIIFTIIQITYLYGGTNKVLPGGFTYSEYARRGFFELVFITLVNLIGVTILKIYVDNSKVKLNIILNIIYTIIVVLTLNMACSAFYRMYLYIDAFGYTRLRILVQLFVILLGIIIFLQFLFIWKDKSIFKYIIVVSLTLYIGINFFNIDSFIAKKNIELSADKKIDNNYLTVLSLDSIKVMNKARNEGKIDDETYFKWKNGANIKIDNWYEYNYFIYKANGK